MIDLKTCGIDNYAKHESTKILLMAYAFDNGSVQLWQPHKTPDMPKEILNALLDDAVIKIAWNVNFERSICRHVLKIDVPIEQWIDPMIYSRYLSLPGSLAESGRILGLAEDQLKIRDGKRLIKKFCLPTSGKLLASLFGDLPPTFYTEDSAPADWILFCNYCIRDVETERAIYDIMKSSKFPEVETEGWRLDQKINSAGIPVNRVFIENALQMAEAAKIELDKELVILTGLDNPNSRNQLIAWAKSKGYPFESIRKDFVDKFLDGKDTEETVECKKVLRVRKEASKTSYKKFEAIASLVSSDHRLRNQFMYLGASRSGRWSGVGVQVQNLARPNKAVEKDYDAAVKLIMECDYSGVKEKFSSVINTITSCVRSSFQAPEGKKFAICDLNAIENRVLGWVSGCPSILSIFEKELDPYIAFAVKLYHMPYEELINDKAKRQIAKPAVLGAGYGLGGGEIKRDGFGNWVKGGLWGYAENMGVVMEKEEAHAAVKTFREAYPEVPAFWKRLDAAAISVIVKGGSREIGPINLRRRKRTNGEYVLIIELPSGRCLHYMNARVQIKIYEGYNGAYEKPAIIYDGIGHGVGKVNDGWGMVYTYGGKLTENIVQAIARDVLLHGMIDADKKGAEIILHVHDEIVALVESDASKFQYKDLKESMEKCPWWAEGLPLKADGETVMYYQK